MRHLGISKMDLPVLLREKIDEWLGRTEAAPKKRPSKGGEGVPPPKKSKNSGGETNGDQPLLSGRIYSPNHQKKQVDDTTKNKKPLESEGSKVDASVGVE